MLLTISLFFNVLLFLALCGAAMETKRLETEIKGLDKLKVFIPDLSSEELIDMVSKQPCMKVINPSQADVIEETLRRR